MQNKLRFGELHNVCFNKENYTHPLQKELEPFTNVGRTETINEVVTRENMEFLLLDSVANNDKERIEKQVGIIIKGERDNTNDKAVLQLHRQILTYGTPLWTYLHKIEDDSITVYHLVQKMGEDEYWQKKRINLIFSENEICYCIIKILCNYLRDNERFNIEYNRYLNLFEGTEKEFINFLVDTKFNTYIDGHINIKDLPYYERLTDKLYDIKNNLSTPDHVEDGKKVEIKPKCRSYSLLYFILIEKKIETSFDLRPEGKIKSIKIVTDKLGIDATQFRKELDSFHKPKTRININNKKNYREVIQLLNEDPINNKEAILMAMNELKIIAPLI